MRRSLLPLFLIAAILATAHAVATPAMWPVDETSHIAYADHLVQTGSVPTIDTPIPTDVGYPGLDARLAWEVRERRSGRLDMWTGNHPPLAFLIQGLALRAGAAVASPALALFMARMTSVLWLLAAVALTVGLARVLVPGRPRAAMAAGLVVASTPTLTHLAGLVFNDVPALALSTACLLVGAIIVRDGPTPRNVGWLGLVAGLAALTRVSTVPAIVAALAMACYGLVRHRRDIANRRALVGAVAAAAAMLLPGAAFYAMNIARYGDITGMTVLFEKFGRDPNSPIGELLFSDVFWRRLWNRMIGDLTTGHWSHGWPARVSGVLLFIVVASLVWGLVARLITRPGERTRPGDLTRPGARPAARALQRAMWLGCMALPAGLLVTTIRFHSAGGSLHGRYLLGAHAVTALVMAVAVGRLPRVGRHSLWLIGTPLLAVNIGLLSVLITDPNATWARRGIPLGLPTLLGAATTPTLWALAIAGLPAVVLLARTWAELPEDPIITISLRAPGRQAGRPASLPEGRRPAHRPSSIPTWLVGPPFR